MPRLRLCWLALALCTPAQAQESPAEELKSVRGRIEALEKQVNDKEQTRKETAKAVRESERDVQDARRRLKEIRAREKLLQEQLQALESQHESLSGALSTQREMLSRLVYQQYLTGAPQTLQLVLSGQEAGEVARKLHYMTYISQARGKVVADLRVNLAELERVSAQTAESKQALNALGQQAQAEQQKLSRELRARESTLSKVSTDIKRTQEEIDALKKNEKRLASLIKHLSREKARKKTPKGASPSERSAFATLKGRLPRPVIGNITNRFGATRPDSGLTWKGVVIAAPAGEEVIAVAPGTVVYAGTLRGFGKLVIVDHGDGYMSLYANNQSLSRRVGDKVGRGDTIAAVGQGDEGVVSGLYFEIRVQGKPVDPMKWVARQ